MPLELRPTSRGAKKVGSSSRGPVFRRFFVPFYFLRFFFVFVFVHVTLLYTIHLTILFFSYF